MSKIPYEYFSDRQRSIGEPTAQFFKDEDFNDWKTLQEARNQETIVATRVISLEHRELPGIEHDVAWLWRQGIDTETGEPYDFCHAACKCIVHSTSVSDLSPMYGCQAWHTAGLIRAWEVRDEDRLDLEEMSKLAVLLTDTVLGLDGSNPEAEAILRFMRNDRANPRYWYGNYLNGHFQTPTLSALTGFEEDKVEETADELVENGWLVKLGEGTYGLASDFN